MVAVHKDVRWDGMRQFCDLDERALHGYHSRTATPMGNVASGDR